MAYRDDREALLARAEALEGELARERTRSAQASAEAKKLRRHLGIVTRALGRGAVMPGPTAGRLLPLVVASLVGAATLIGVNVGRVRPPPCHLAPSVASLVSSQKESVAPKPPAVDGVRLVPMGMGLVTIDSRPFSRVWLDGHALGVTPLDSVLVPVGSHVFGFEVPGAPMTSRRVVVSEGRETRLHLNLDPARSAFAAAVE